MERHAQTSKKAGEDRVVMAGGTGTSAETVSKEPIAPIVRKGDPQRSDIARWTFNALVTAEQLGITQREDAGS